MKTSGAATTEKRAPIFAAASIAGSLNAAPATKSATVNPSAAVMPTSGSIGCRSNESLTPTIWSNLRLEC